MKIFHSKNKGQEIIEFALIGALVFLGALFTMLAFSKQLSSFFKSSSINSGHKVEAITANNNNNNPNSPPTTKVNVNIGNSQTVEIEIPSGGYYMQTTGSQGDQREIISNLGQYTSDLTDALDTIATKVNNGNLNDLIEAIRNTASLEKGVLGYDTSGGTQNPPRWSIDPNGDVGEQMNSVVKSLDISMNQLSNETSQVGLWSNYITDMNQQNDFAKKLQISLARVNADSSLSSDVKAVANSIADEVKNIADSYSYSIDSDKYDTVYSDFNSIYSSLLGTAENNKIFVGDLSTVSSNIVSNNEESYSSDLINFVKNYQNNESNNSLDGDLNYVIEDNSLKIELPSISTTTATSKEKAESVVKFMKMLQNTNNTNKINNLSSESKQKITDLLNTLQIKINAPEEGVINTNLGAEILQQLG